MARAEGSISVSVIFLKQPSLTGRFFSQILSYWFFSLSSSFRSFSSSLNEKIFSSAGILNGLEESSDIEEFFAFLVMYALLLPLFDDAYDDIKFDLRNYISLYFFL